ncbi:alpha/beta hydrolase [Neptuniibacter sp. 1_MG-2023]|uniref:alpha/beta hydrolase n=1 Tax=Neptuniibacter sp. 1_MG-2023 TaxID=3062662 RepID=UPI0026E2DBC8|nr:alpha/beta hydrolase [Neptuniibacter sp. 1_MG-2023]MDO6593182.1 alpha/beta hydrolase [Neptuniibacter sp. 1_MG-2023]
MGLFERDLLIRSLPAYTDAAAGVLNDQIRAYLKTYQLMPLVNRSKYRIGRIKLDGIEVTLQSYSQEKGSACRGTVIVLHGYMDHVGLYKHLIDRLLRDGFDVLCYDLSGHGLSDGDPLSVEDFKHYATQLADLIAFVKSDIRGPLHLIGQSTGGAVIMAHQLLFTHENTPLIGERVLLAPLVRSSSWRAIQRKFRWLKYIVKRVPRGYSNNTHDLKFRQFINEEDPLQYKEIPVNWVGAMLAWGRWIESHEPVSGIIHMIQGTDDDTVDWRYNLAILGRLYPELELTLINGAKHHLVNETAIYREEVFEKVGQIFNHWENKNGR